MISNETLLNALRQTVSHLKREIFTQELLRKALVFAFENSKLKDTYTFSLPAGWTCPGANICLAKVNRETGKLIDGPDTFVRCFSASAEAIYPTVRAIRWHNFDQLQEAGNLISMVSLILQSLPEKAKLVRIHVSGDFFSQTYFDAWVLVARARPSIVFYAYTKSVPFWLSRTKDIPNNFKLNASLGSKFDDLAIDNELKTARIVFSEKEAQTYGLEINEDDKPAWARDNDFALLVHGTQPKNSEAGKAWWSQLMEIRKEAALAPAKVKRTVQPPTVGSLTATIIRLAQRLAAILARPVFTVQRLG
jgi:hypothetical protein